MKQEERWARLESRRLGNTEEKFRASLPLLAVVAILAVFFLFMDFGQYFSSSIPSRNLCPIKRDSVLLIWILARIAPFVLGIGSAIYIVLRKRWK